MKCEWLPENIEALGNPII